MTTSQTIFEKRLQWVARLKTNPPKATGKLKTDKGTCCLGEVCLMEGIKPKIEVDRGICHYFFDSEETVLPENQQKSLGITRSGALTCLGELLAFDFFGVRHACSWLMEINDYHTRDHKHMGEFLEWLLVEEYLNGKEVFKREA